MFRTCYSNYNVKKSIIQTFKFMLQTANNSNGGSEHKKQKIFITQYTATSGVEITATITTTL